MDKTTYIALREDLSLSLGKGQLGRALEVLHTMAATLKAGVVLMSVEELRENYSRLLEYFLKGAEDANRETLIKSFVRQAYELADALHRSFTLIEGNSHYASVRNTLQHMGVSETFCETDLRQCSPRQLFEVAWTATTWKKGDLEVATALLSEAEATEDTAIRLPLLVSGCTLSLLYHFDALRLKFLLTAATHRNTLVKARALVGTVLVFLTHGKRLHLYPELLAQTSLLADEQEVREALLSIQIQLLLTLETKKIERSLREEILPEVMKHVRKARNEQRSPLEMDENALSDIALNPEWDEDGKPSVLGKKMRELHDMQQKGADIFMSSFKMLKQNFPFFGVAANWFYPFTPQHSDLQASAGISETLERLMNQAHLCNSDRYSLSLMFAGMNAHHGNPLSDKLNESLAGLSEAELPLEGNEKLSDEQLNEDLRIYIQDVHRYFKLFRNRDKDVDPFTGDLLLTEYEPFRSILSEEAALRSLADFTLAEKHYAYAIEFFSRLPKTAETCQKTGYAHQMLHNYAAALTAYEQANLMEEDSIWTLRQQANCLRILGRVEEAVPLYLRVEKSQPEDKKLLLLLGECYLRLGRYEAAFEKLFKADYLFPDDAATMRALAWCSLLAGKYEQAERYYQKLLHSTPTFGDTLNAGHTLWLSGRPGEAVEYYAKALALEKKEFVPMDLFDADSEMLSERGLRKADQALMLDAVMNAFQHKAGTP